MRWAIRNRLTLTYGIRYDYFANSFPEQYVGPAQFAPARNFLFPEDKNAAWHDLSPRSSVAVDLFGNGRTALKEQVWCSRNTNRKETSPAPPSRLAIPS